MGKLKRNFKDALIGVGVALALSRLFENGLEYTWNHKWWAVVLCSYAFVAVVRLLFEGWSFRETEICKLCSQYILSEQDKTEWHGLGNCVPVCERCMGSGIEPEGVQNGEKENSENIQIQKR